MNKYKQIHKYTSIEKHKLIEERARRILIHHFPEKYDTSRLFESPDIIVDSLSIGVEVTDSVRKTVCEKLSKASDIAGKRINELSKLNIDNIVRNEIRVDTIPNGQCIPSFYVWGDTHDLLNSYVKKTEILNKNHYSVYNENNLFIMTFMIDHDELVSGIQSIFSCYLENLKGKNVNNFDNVYIYTGNNTIYTLVLKNQEIIISEKTDKSMAEISEEAKRTIIGTCN